MVKPSFGELFVVKDDCTRHTPGQVLVCVQTYPDKVNGQDDEYRFRGVLLERNTVWNFYTTEVNSLCQSLTGEDTIEVYAGVR